MNLGAEPKKVAILAVLVVAALGGLYYNSTGDSSSEPAPRVAPVIPAGGVPVRGAPAPAKAKTPVRQSLGEFRAKMPGTGPDDKIDPASIDPELRLDLLAKVQAVEPIEAGRNLFQFGAAPPPDKPLPAVPTGVPKITVNNQPPPHPQPVVPAGPPAPPPAPPINLKYYGYEISKLDGHKQAFLLDGEEVILAGENETVKKRYRIVRIALTSIDIEDTQSKSTQTLKLQDNPA